MAKLLPVLEGYRRELAIERERLAKIKEKYGLTSLEHLIVQLDGEMIQLYARRDEGENVDLVIRNKEEQKRGYEAALEELTATIAQEGILTMSTPNFVGAVRVIPTSIEDATMKSDPEIERIGMEVSMRYERQQGRTPEDVSAENLGFDVRSTDKAGRKRYIEVKARAGQGAVMLTQNEWFKAKQFRSEYFLYAVLNALSAPACATADRCNLSAVPAQAGATQPELYIIQNPAEQTQPEAKIEVVRYLIPLAEIREKGLKTDA